jgi:hypothetical protein
VIDCSWHAAKRHSQNCLEVVSKGGNVIRNLFIALLCILWVIMLMKTILAIQFHDSSPSLHYYGGMLENSWQGHFNTDLLIHSVLIACWIFYREKSKIIGVLCGSAAVYFGAVFSLLYLIVTSIRSNTDMDLFFNGKKTI